MSLISRKGLLRRIQRGRRARSLMVGSNLSEGIAFQIRATRDRRKLTQAELAEASGMTQNNLSRLESPDYGKQTISSLKRIADALDIALVVRFVPFSQYIDWLSSTPRIDRGLSPESLSVPSFDEDPGLKEAEGKLVPFEKAYGMQNDADPPRPAIDELKPLHRFAPKEMEVKKTSGAWSELATTDQSATKGVPALCG